MPIHMDNIKQFLRRVEGPQQLRGYIPCHKAGGGTANYRGGPSPEAYTAMGISGVTVATGVDLGQTSAANLRNFGVDSGVVNALMPYLGKRQDDAIAVLRRLPLTISQDAADMLDACLHAYHARIIAARYDRDAGDGAFAALPWQAQTAIYSILYQRGTGSPKKFPHTWDALVRGNWADAAARLCYKMFWSGYVSRRAAEGALLKELI